MSGSAPRWKKGTLIVNYADAKLMNAKLAMSTTVLSARLSQPPDN